MAREGIQDFDAGVEALKAALYDYHERKSFYLGLTFADYLLEKVAIKARQYNSMLNKTEADEQAGLDLLAREYRKQSDGE